MRCPPDWRHRSVCCGFECTYVCPVLTRNRLSERSQNIYATQPPTDGVMRVFTAVTVKQRPRVDNERHSTYILNDLEQKQCLCLLLYNSVRFPGKMELLLEVPQASIVLLVGSAYRWGDVGKTGRMKQTDVNRMTWRTRPFATLPTENYNMDWRRDEPGLPRWKSGD